MNTMYQMSYHLQPFGKTVVTHKVLMAYHPNFLNYIIHFNVKSENLFTDLYVYAI